MRDILNSRGINVYVNTISAQEPLEVETNDNTSSTMKIKNLNGFGNAGQIIRTSGTALGYSNVCNLQNILTTKTGGGLRFYEYTENDGAGTTNLITLGNATDNLKFIITHTHTRICINNTWTCCSHIIRTYHTW